MSSFWGALQRPTNRLNDYMFSKRRSQNKQDKWFGELAIHSDDREVLQCIYRPHITWWWRNMWIPLPPDTCTNVLHIFRHISTKTRNVSFSAWGNEQVRQQCHHWVGHLVLLSVLLLPIRRREALMTFLVNPIYTTLWDSTAGSAAASFYALSSSYFLFSFFFFLFSLSVSLAFFWSSLLALSFFPFSPISTPFELEMAKSAVLFLSVIHHAKYLLKSITYDYIEIFPCIPLDLPFYSTTLWRRIGIEWTQISP